MAKITNTQLLESALEKVESKSIKEWANSTSNRPIFEKIAQGAIDKGNTDVNRFAAYITCLAIGA